MEKLSLSKLLPQLKNRQWYNQRFDGSPLFLHFMGAADVKQDPRKPKGTNGKIGICFFERGKADWYFALDDITSGANSVVVAAKKDSKLSKKLLAKWEHDERIFEKFFWETFPSIQLKKLSNDELFALLQKLFTLFTNATSSTSIIDRFALGTDQSIGNMLRHELFSHKKYRESEFVSLFSALTAPVHQSFINEAEIALLKIAAKKSRMTLAAYQSRYFWIHNNYVAANTLTENFFKKQLRAWKNSRVDLLKEATRIASIPLQNKRKKIALLKKLRLSLLLKTLLTITEDFTWWQDQRKKYTYFNIHMGNQILQEIARRTHYNSETLKYTLLHELASILERKNPSAATLQKRIHNSAFVLTPMGAGIYEGVAAKKLKAAITHSSQSQDVQDFRGLSACTGRAVGKVRIIKSVKEIGTIRKGEILVAVMTRPDYIPAMKKAAAIITNEGGITSHAAIVSRELGIPCIIGTKIATEVLKNGDLVQVNANHGWVKKLPIKR